MRNTNKAANPPSEGGTFGVRNDVPPHLLPLFRKAAKGKSRAAAIKAFCLSCVGFIKTDVRNCTAPTCALFSVRPYASGDVIEEGVENE